MNNEEEKLNRKHSHHKHHHRSFWQRHKIWKWVLIVIGLFIVADIALFGKMYFDAKKSANSTYKQVKTNKLLKPLSFLPANVKINYVILQI